MTFCPKCPTDSPAILIVAQCEACKECDLATAEAISAWIAWRRAEERRRKAFENRLKAIAS